MRPANKCEFDTQPPGFLFQTFASFFQILKYFFLGSDLRQLLQQFVNESRIQTII